MNKIKLKISLFNNLSNYKLYKRFVDLKNANMLVTSSYININVCDKIVQI